MAKDTGIAEKALGFLGRPITKEETPEKGGSIEATKKRTTKAKVSEEINKGGRPRIHSEEDLQNTPAMKRGLPAGYIRYTIAINEQLKKDLKAAARTERLSITEAIEEALAAYVTSIHKKHGGKFAEQRKRKGYSGVTKNT